MYLHEEGDKERLPAAVTLKTTEKDRRYLAKPRVTAIRLHECHVLKSDRSIRHLRAADGASCVLLV